MISLKRSQLNINLEYSDSVDTIVKYLTEQIFNHQGQQFSLKIGYVQKEMQRNIAAILGVWKNKIYTPVQDPIPPITRAFPIGVSVAIESENVDIERGSVIERGIVYSNWEYKFIGLIVSVSVEPACFYRLFGTTGFAFRDYLLTNRRKLVENLLQSTIGQWLAIRTWTIATPDGEGGATMHPTFSARGMEDLPSMGHCYGLALAMIDVLNSNPSVFQGYVFKEMLYQIDSQKGSISDDIIVYFTEQTPQAPILEKW